MMSMGCGIEYYEELHAAEDLCVSWILCFDLDDRNASPVIPKRNLVQGHLAQRAPGDLALPSGGTELHPDVGTGRR